MISAKIFYESLKKNEISFFTGVPDSLLKSICAYITDFSGKDDHIIAANEGAAVGLAIGYHLSTGKVPLVYMQNSGIGNAVNPLISLADPKVYGIPMILLVGWRGEPGVKDEPQHVKQGEITLRLFESMDIPYSVLDGACESISNLVSLAKQSALNNSGTHAIVVKKNTFEPYQLSEQHSSSFGWTREDAIKMIVDLTRASDVIVSTTGMASRELYEYRTQIGHDHKQDFLTVGGMGHASQIALGIAYQKRDQHVLCIDGDGANLMHMGSMATNAMSRLSNFKHILINNGAHDSVGGQPTAGLKIDLPAIARATGYLAALTSDNKKDAKELTRKILNSEGPAFLELKVDKGNRPNLGRPKSTPVENKKSLMELVSQ